MLKMLFVDVSKSSRWELIFLWKVFVFKVKSKYDLKIKLCPTIYSKIRLRDPSYIVVKNFKVNSNNGRGFHSKF